MSALIDLKNPDVAGALKTLLMDKTTGRNIIWATDTYEELGKEFEARKEITLGQVSGMRGITLEPRTAKTDDAQKSRTRKHAEVFTPAWLCNRMNNFCDETWFGRKEVFNRETESGWETEKNPIAVPKRKKWQWYIDRRILEITCGEAPFLVSRYDAATGEILPLGERIGLLDRKIRMVNENTDNEADWLKWVFRAFESTYGYEYQGDNLLIARINLFLTFTENLAARWQRSATRKERSRIANIIAWNIWQMDGLKHVPPDGALYVQYEQMSLFSLLGLEEATKTATPCRIQDWRSMGSVKFSDRINRKGKVMKFDYVIGNPPYNREAPGESTSDKPIYNEFMDLCYTIGEKVELITPARFLFNAGATSKEWNNKMLNDPHLRVLYYESDAGKVFPNNTITGGIVVTYRDEKSELFPIEIFVPFPYLNGIRQKVHCKQDDNSISRVFSGRTPYLFTERFHEENPYAVKKLSKGHFYDISSNALEVFPDVFLRECPEKPEGYYRILGRVENKRAYCWVRKEYVRERATNSIGKWKVFLPKANGASGMLGEEAARLISKPEIGSPMDIATDTFLVIGSFETRLEAEALLKYINSKFARILLGILKVTQDNSADKWKYVPLQDFTPASDIDWSVSIPEIDQQLYKKYGLNETEIAFIESKVKEMT